MTFHSKNDETIYLAFIAITLKCFKRINLNLVIREVYELILTLKIVKNVVNGLIFT